MGLYNYKARFYSTVTGRFVSVDPVVGSPGNPQSWNAYSYVGNNPLHYADPTGTRRTDEIEADEEELRRQRDVEVLADLASRNCDPAFWLGVRANLELGPSGSAAEAAEYLHQVYDYLGHGGPPGPVDVAIDVVPYIGDGRASLTLISRPGMSLRWGVGVVADSR